MSDRDVVIVSGARTAIGQFNGAFAKVSAIELGSKVISESLKRVGVNYNSVDEVIMGNVLSAGLGQNPARQSALKAELPINTPALTINKVCGSGLKSVHLGAQSILLGDAEVIIAGGMENMSQAPYLLKKARNGYRMGDGKVVDSMIEDGLWCAMNDYHMGITAENLSDKYNITREEQDAFAADSQEKAIKAIETGTFEPEIVTIDVPERKGDFTPFNMDEYPKKHSTVESLSRLKPAFKENGSVTAGNASGINDGAAAVVLMSRKKAKELNLKPMAVIKANAHAAVDPEMMGIGPVPSIKKVLEKSNLSIGDIELIELNEAFAAQSIAVSKELQLDMARVNVNGGAIALGHPIGASGTRILISLLYEMEHRQAKYGLASLCIGGGQGVATIIERES
ncbi:acetyl-CoA C-acetyltransferase [Oceanobacillus timonensis]|uniref:acetyl-CoA C-acetyltransferase n=1 Tax=Oceanobacillus timonensis TaxID=1926285 RepID=UPI0009BA8468|nr:acetyl-CoA C-acetyltransferase [Oceanobacillus timonensis]